MRCAMMRLTSDSQPARAARGDGKALKAIPQHKNTLAQVQSTPRCPEEASIANIANIARRGLWSVEVSRV